MFCQPKAARVGLVGLHADSLKVKVRAPALEGRANEALLAFLAEVLGAPVGRLTLVAGEASRMKRVRVEGLPAAEVEARLAAFLAKYSRH